MSGSVPAESRPDSQKSDYGQIDWTDVPLVSEQGSVRTLEGPGYTESTAPLVPREEQQHDVESLQMEDPHRSLGGTVRDRAGSCVNSKACRQTFGAAVTLTVVGGLGAAWLYSKAEQSKNPPP